MIITNSKMLKILLKEKVSGKLNSKLKTILDEGFIRYKGCYFLKQLLKEQQYISRSDFNDKTHFECFINSVNLDEFQKKNLFSQAIFLMMEIEKKWNIYKRNLFITIIIAKTNSGYNLKFHLTRNEVDWINPNEIENFDEAILICRKTFYTS